MSAQSTNPANINPLTQSQVPQRRRITRWIKGAWTGLIAGTLFLAVQMLLAAVFSKGGVWDALRLSASVALGSQAVATAVPMSFRIFIMGLFVHFLLSIWYAVVLGMLISNLKPATAALVGAGFGLLLYFVHFYGLTHFYPWIVDARNWIAIVAHLMFGISAAWVYSHLHMRELARESGLLSETGTA